MSKSTLEHVYGWLPDTPDQRDHLVAVTAPVKLPPSVDLRSICPPVYDQGQLGSCTANAIAAAFDVDRKIQGKAFISPSRLEIYYNERALEGTTSTDSGAAIRDGIKTMKTNGVAPEALWPYIIRKFAKRPPASVTKAALANEALAYARVAQSQQQMQQVLASGRPIVAGFTVYDSFESPQVAKTGIVPMPAAGEQTLGGHAILIVGYLSIAGILHFIVRNSWGTTWGDAGYCYMPAAYLTSHRLASDFWSIQTITT